MKFLLLSALAVVALSGCSSVSQVTPMGSDTYSVGSQVKGGFTSWSEVKAMAVKRATEYCAAQDKNLKVVDVATHGARGWTPQEAEVTFKCEPRS